VVGDRSVDQFLLYHFSVTHVVCGNLHVGGEFDGWGVGGISHTSSRSPGEGRIDRVRMCTSMYDGRILAGSDLGLTRAVADDVHENNAPLTHIFLR